MKAEPAFPIKKTVWAQFYAAQLRFFRQVGRAGAHLAGLCGSCVVPHGRTRAGGGCFKL